MISKIIQIHHNYNPYKESKELIKILVKIIDKYKIYYKIKRPKIKFRFKDLYKLIKEIF